MKSRNTTKRFTDTGHSGGYLHGVLLDGAKPFLYRSGVRSLLGVPDGGGGIQYAPPMPPAGFQYVQHPRSDGRTPGTPGEDHEVVREYPHRIARAAEEDGAMDRGHADPVSTATSSVSPVATQMPSPPAMPRAAREAHRSLDVPGEPSLPTATASEERTGMSMEIPGISRAISDFPALRSTVAPEELQPRREHPGRKESNPSQDPATPSADAPVADLPMADRSPVVHAPTPRMATPRREPPAQEPKGKGNREQVSERGREGEMVHSIESRSNQPRTTEALVPMPRHEPSMPARAIVPTRHNPFAEQESYPEPADPTAGALAIRGALDGGRGKGRTEGVEQIVERVIARREAARGVSDDESQRPREPQQQVQVVLAQRPAPQAKIPCAFWERSYLHRFRIRTLR